jgi:hypothetical protein
MADHTSEGLVYNIEKDHEELQFIHEVFAGVLGGIIEQAQEVYVRSEIARGLTLVATPFWDHLEARQACARRAYDEAIEDEHNYWFNNY